MLLAVLILLAALVALVAGAVGGLVAPHLFSHRGRRVIVNLRSGPSLTGQLARQWGARLELTDATLHEQGTVRQLDGRAIAYKTNVGFVQVLPPVDPDVRP